jgi:hypothetical protein
LLATPQNLQEEYQESNSIDCGERLCSVAFRGKAYHGK